MKVTKKQILEAASKISMFTGRGDVMMPRGCDVDTFDWECFHVQIGVEEYPCGNQILELFKNLGIEVTEE